MECWTGGIARISAELFALRSADGLRWGADPHVGFEAGSVVISASSACRRRRIQISAPNTCQHCRQPGQGTVPRS